MIGRHHDILLDPSVERRLIRTRRHWAILLPVILQTFGIVIGMFLLSWITTDHWLAQSVLWYVAVFALLRLAWNVLEWWHEIVIITSSRFLVNSGIISTKSAMMPKKRVTDMKFEQTLLGQLLNYGSLRLESAGQKQDLEEIEYMPQPGIIFKVVSEQVFAHELPNGAPTSKGMPSPRWISRRGRLWLGS